MSFTPVTKHIPNALTCCNLSCGFLGIYALWHQEPEKAAILIILAALFDFADGLAARALNAHSIIGKDLDSLADLVTFGVLPGFIYVFLIESYFPEAGAWKYLCVIVPIASALRLAKFNHDTRQSVHFIGMPTPAHAVWAGSLPFALELMEYEKFGTDWGIVLIAVVMSVLMVSEIPFFSLKIKSIKERENIYGGILVIISLLSLFFMGLAAGVMIIGSYLLLSIARILLKNESE